MTRNPLPTAALVLVLPLAAVAQDSGSTGSGSTIESDPGFLERIIQNALGGDGRTVRIEGLQGALSSEVKIGTIEVSDNQGIWLTIKDVTMDWSRLALLRRRLEIDSLTVGSIDVVRSPVSPPAETPALEASSDTDTGPKQPFQLPDLPVAITLGKLDIATVDLGQQLAGQAATLHVEGTATLKDGVGSAILGVDRTDGKDAKIDLDAGFVNDSRRLWVNLDASEAAGGLISTLAHFPGAPSVDLSVHGDAPLSDFDAKIRLATDGEPRLAGTVDVVQNLDTDGNIADQTVSADLGGDITPLFAPQYRDFFGTQVGLNFQLVNDAAGTELKGLKLSSYALNLTGDVRLAPNFMPTYVNIDGHVGAPDALPVILPLPGDETTLNSGTLVADYDAAKGDAFQARLSALGLRRQGLAVNATNLALRGTLTKTDDPLAVQAVSANIVSSVQGISTGDDKADAALRQALNFNADADYTAADHAVKLRNISLDSGDLALTGTADVTGLDTGNIQIATDADLKTGDLARFAPLTGQKLAGTLDGALKAQYALGTGAFDVALTGNGQSLAIGNAKVDPLIAGPALVDVKARRDAQGITLDKLDIKTDQVTATGSGTLSSTLANLKLDASVAQAHLLAPQLDGPLTLAAAVTGGGTDYKLDVTAGGEALTRPLGSPVTLTSDVTRKSDGSEIDVSDLALAAGALKADGKAQLTGLKDKMAVAADLDIDTGDLAPFATLTGMPLAGSLKADAKGSYDTATGFFDAVLNGTTHDLKTGVAQADALLAGTNTVALDAARDADGITLKKLDVQGPQVQATGQGSLGEGSADLTLNARLAEAGLVAPQLKGPLTLDARVDGKDNDYAVDLGVGGAALTDKLGDPAKLHGQLRRDPAADTLAVRDLSLTAGDLALTGTADITALTTQPGADATVKLVTGDLHRFAALTGLPLKGKADIDLVGNYHTDTGYFGVDVTGQAHDVGIGSAQIDQLLAGQTDLNISAGRGADGIHISNVNVKNPALTLAGDGTIARDTGTAHLSGQLANLGIFVPQLKGPLTLEAKADGQGGTWTTDVHAKGPQGLHADVTGPVTGSNIAMKIDAGLGNLAALVPQLAGSAGVTGTVTGANGAYNGDLAVKGPAGTAATVKGRLWGQDGTMDAKIDGTVPLAMANAFITPRSLTGAAKIDMAVKGAPGLDAVSGKVTINGARLTDPETKIVLEQIALNLGIAQNKAQLDLSTHVSTGGTITLKGPVDLTAPFNGDLGLALRNVKLVDPQLYTIDLGGDVSMKGPMAGGAAIKGKVDIARAEIKVPSSFGSGGTIPDMQHVAEPADSRLTRKRAGIVTADAGASDGSASGSAVAYPLDVQINAPEKVYVRGRGLDIEMGGGIHIGGTTAAPSPSGQIGLIRGYWNILAKKLTFTKANVQLGGDLVPDIDMVAESDSSDVDATIEISGRADDPEISFSSSPELPQDEVLAQIFFNKSIKELSPLEIAQLASAIRTLSGSGGEGMFEKLRQGLGVDQLNVGSDDEGNTEVTAGKYITDKIYTDVSVGADGTSSVDLNYNITPSLSASSGYGSDGDTRVGVKFKKDY